MNFRDYLSLLGKAEVYNSCNFEVKGVAYDYRKVKQGYIYVAINIFNYQGKERDGHEFIKEAVVNGALAIVVKRKISELNNICQIICVDTRSVLELISAHSFDYPAKKLITIGVTGTKGKTTTIYLIDHILEANNISTGFISTANFKIGKQEISNFTYRVNETHLTCPESLELQSSLDRMVKQGNKVAVIEATSHALKLHRASGQCYYDVGILTNLQSDHLDFHKTTKDYYNSKMELFKIVRKTIPKGVKKCAIYNSDDPKSELVRSQIAGCKSLTYGIKRLADYQAKNISICKFLIEFKINKFPFITKLIGLHNIYNISAAVAVCHHLGIPLPKIAKALKSFGGAPGRMQEVTTDQGYRVFVDYAHTPESLEACLSSLNMLEPKKLTVVFGCPGNRDKTKRAKMGLIASHLADYFIVTSDDPRLENPQAIASEIVSQVDDTNYHVELDRETAISSALHTAKENEIIVIAGKGDEKTFDVDNKQLDWNDVGVVKKYLKGL